MSIDLYVFNRVLNQLGKTQLVVFRRIALCVKKLRGTVAIVCHKECWHVLYVSL